MSARCSLWRCSFCEGRGLFYGETCPRCLGAGTAEAETLELERRAVELERRHGKLSPLSPLCPKARKLLAKWGTT